MSTGLTACGSSGSKVSVDNVQKAADAVVAAPTTPCPAGFDLDAALKKAGVTATAKPGSADDAAALAMSATNALQGSPLKTSGTSMITCVYTLSTGGTVVARLTGAHTGKAITVLKPLLHADSDASTSEVDTFVAQKFSTGKPALTPGGKAAVVELDATGGDVVLDVTSYSTDKGDEAKNPITGEPLRKLAEALSKQVKI
ncbi:MAG: hypothetical protein HOW97_43485 [Catenulispora sp.]|nr:hypothetical protein [Catenulispora sp.]